MKKELKEAIKIELSQMASQHSPPVDAPDPDVLAARVSTKGSCAEATGNVVAEEPSVVDVTSMGLYIAGEDCTRLVSLGKVFDSATMIHNVPYTNDVVQVSVLTVYDGGARVPFPTSEIQYVREATNTFIGWQTHLMKPISDDSDHNVPKPMGHVDGCTAEANGTPLGRDEIRASKCRSKIFHHTSEIIAGDKCLNISILQLWMMFMDGCGRSRGHGLVYGFLEPQSIHNAKDRCQHYIETWVKESQRQLYLGAYLNYAMKIITSTFEGMSDQAAPRWIEPKSHLQTGGYECGYYVMHWMWCIVTGGLKDG
ncbi:hypothetical protein GmHk_14G040794 [Glycine max]|nr:hypothetical protein GmHk_14G040794 [Glycine max]